MRTRTMHEKNRTKHDTPLQPKTLGSVATATMMFAIARGIPAERITAETGLTQVDLLDPNARLAQGIIPKIWRLLTTTYPGEVLSIEMAKATPFSIMGIMAQGLGYAPTMRAALDLLQRNGPVLSDGLEITVIERADEIEVVTDHPMLVVDEGAAIELAYALGRRVIVEIGGLTGAIIRIDFSHNPFGPIDVYEAFFDADVRFEQGINRAVFSRHLFDRPVPHANAMLFSYVHQHLEQTRRKLADATMPEVLQRVYAAVSKNAESGDYSAASIAKRMNMSLRTLQRLTREHGVEVRQLIDEARAQNARQLLSDTSLSTDMIAHVLGYSDDRAFRRAFKRWSGQTPSEYRESILS